MLKDDWQWVSLDNFRIGASFQKDKAWLEAWKFQPHCLTCGEGRGTWDPLTHQCQWFNHSCLHNETSIKTLKNRVQRDSRVGEHIKMLGGWHSQGRHGNPSPNPYLALFISSIWLFLSYILYKKPLIGLSVVVHACKLSKNLGGQGERIALAYKFETSLGNKVRPCFYKK